MVGINPMKRCQRASRSSGLLLRTLSKVNESIHGVNNAVNEAGQVNIWFSG